MNTGAKGGAWWVGKGGDRMGEGGRGGGAEFLKARDKHSCELFQHFFCLFCCWFVCYLLKKIKFVEIKKVQY